MLAHEPAIGAIQVPSGPSILVYHDKVLYKYICDSETGHKMAFVSVHGTEHKDGYLLPKCSKQYGNTTKYFLQYNCLHFPMERDEALECLPDFVRSVADTITSLHTAGLAHLDIRLDNICFSILDHHAVLIDLDKYLPVTVPAIHVPYRNLMSVMYMLPPSLGRTATVAHLDW